MKDWKINLQDLRQNSQFTLKEFFKLMAKGNKDFNIKDQNGNIHLHLSNENIKEMVCKEG